MVIKLFIDFSSFFFSAFFVIFLISFLVVFVRTNELSSRLVRWGLFVSTFLLVVRGVVYSIAQYWSFQTGLLKFLPFDQLVIYTIRYSALHYFSSFFLGLAIAFFLFIIFWILEKRSHGRLLDTNERYLVVVGALAVGWPGAVLYAVGVFVLPLLATPWLLQTTLRITEDRPLGSRGRSSLDGRRRVRLAPFIIISALLAMGLTPLILPHASWLEVLVCKTCI